MKLDSELVDPYHHEPATEYGTRKGRQREAKERLEDAAVDMMAEPIAACIKSKKMLAWAPPAERPRRLRARSESTDQSMATATPMQIDGQVPALRGGTLLYDANNRGEIRQWSRSQAHGRGDMRSISSTRKVAAASPKSSDASPITSLANKQGKQTRKTLNLALHHRASGRFADPRFAARE